MKIDVQFEMYIVVSTKSTYLEDKMRIDSLKLRLDIEFIIYPIYPQYKVKYLLDYTDSTFISLRI